MNINKLFISLIFVILVASLFAANNEIILDSGQNEIKIQQSNYQNLQLEFDVAKLSSFEVNSKKGTFSEAI